MRAIRVFAILAVILNIVVIGRASAQDLGSLGLEGVTLTPTVKVGYQWMTTNINIPNRFDRFVGALDNRGPMDLSLKNSGVWVGEIDLEARYGRYRALLGAEASAPKNIAPETQEEPYHAGLYPVQWQGRRFQWSAFDGRAGIDVRPGISFVGGFKVQQWSVKLTEPWDPTGQIQYDHNFFGDGYSADLSAKSWIPYLGVGFEASYFKASFLFSPVAWLDAKIPFRYKFVIVPHSDFFVEYEDDRYRLKKNGMFFEAAVNSDFELRYGLKCSLWAKGNWLRINGNGSQDYENQLRIGGVTLPLFSDSSSAVGSFTSCNVSGGLALESSF